MDSTPEHSRQAQAAREVVAEAERILRAHAAQGTATLLFRKPETAIVAAPDASVPRLTRLGRAVASFFWEHVEREGRLYGNPAPGPDDPEIPPDTFIK